MIHLFYHCASIAAKMYLLKKLLYLVLGQDGLLVGLVDPAGELGDGLVVRDAGRAPVAAGQHVMGKVKKSICRWC